MPISPTLTWDGRGVAICTCSNYRICESRIEKNPNVYPSAHPTCRHVLDHYKTGGIRGYATSRADRPPNFNGIVPLFGAHDVGYAKVAVLVFFRGQPEKDDPDVVHLHIVVPMQPKRPRVDVGYVLRGDLTYSDLRHLVSPKLVALGEQWACLKCGTRPTDLGGLAEAGVLSLHGWDECLKCSKADLIPNV